jgi:hypothetical protein
MSKSAPRPRTLRECRQRYGELIRSLTSIGFVWPGTVQRHMLTCGKPQCACHKAPPSRHGPYFYWTSKKHGKTVSRKLTLEEAEILEEWINNRRSLNDTVKRMMKLSEHALALKLRDRSRTR